MLDLMDFFWMNKALSPKNWGCVNGHEVSCLGLTSKVVKTTGDCMVYFYDYLKLI